jgi:aminoglycoside phosphotransferase (APT) family kinase protein
MTNPEWTVIARGRTAEVLAWQDGQVVKLFYDWVPGSAIEREVRAARIVSAFDLPTPKLLGKLTLDGRQGLLFERVNGRSMLSVLGSKPWFCVRLARQFAGLHAKVHQQAVSDLPLLKEGIERTIREMEGLPGEVREAALARLFSLPEGGMLCHLDFHPDQVMLTSSGPVVIDWMNARAGQPAADVAYTLIMLRIGNVPDTGWFKQQLTNLLRGIFARTYLRNYLKLNPSVIRADIDAWTPLAVIARIADGVPGEKDRLLEMLGKSF